MKRIDTRKKNMLVFGAVMVFAISLVFFVLIWFNANINNMLEDNTGNYLEENTESLAAVFKAKMSDQLIMLESQSRYFADVDMTNYNEMKKTIMSTKGIGAFKTIGVASSSGSTLNYNGRSSGNILLQDYFIEAMNGNEAISKTTSVDEEGDSVLVLAVPIMQNDNIIGAIFGTFNGTVLSELVETSSFDYSSMNILMSKDGTILAKSNSNLISEDSTNFLNYIGTDTVSEDMLGRIINFNNGEQIVKAVIVSVGVHDWYFATLIPESIISKQSAQISGYVAVVVFVILLSFIILAIAIVKLVKNNNDISLRNELYSKASEQSKDIIFDYDLVNKKLRLDGYKEQIIADDIKQFNQNDIQRLLLPLCHPDDSNAFMDFINKPEMTKDTAKTEIRIQVLEGGYNWFKINATFNRNQNGEIYNIVGSIVNVEEQVNKEKMLIEKAEIDPLTGIFNKGAFKDKVSGIIDNASANDLYALYIIDLDYFKKVNDTLGHAMGDKVLTDVAKKLCIIFSDKDFVGRIGGDEFAAFLNLSEDGKNIGRSIIENKARSICGMLRETYKVGPESVSVSSSVGISIFPNAGNKYQELFDNADKVLYEVKNNGKNGFRIYE